jgi:tetratricopeptide (TPR) repeat protein
MEINYIELANQNRKSVFIVVVVLVVAILISIVVGGFYINKYLQQRKQVIEKQENINQSRINIERGISFVREKEYTQAISAYEQALKLDPDAKIPLGDLAFLYYETGNFSAAEQKALEYINKYPNETNLWITYENLGNIYLSLKQYENAIKNFEKALSLAPPQEFNRNAIYNDLGVAYNAVKRYTDAISAYRQAINIIESREINTEELRTNLANTYENLGNAYFRNQPDDQVVGKEARAAYNQAILLRRQY